MTENRYVQIFEEEARKNNITWVYGFKGNCGRAYIDERRVIVSIPINRDRLIVCLHEIGHIVNGHIKPRYIEEMKAEKFAILKMKEFGIPISRKAKARTKNYVSYKIRQAKRRGLKKVSSEAKRFIQ